MLYFDDTVLPFWGCDEQWGLDFLSYYYNHMSNLNDGGEFACNMSIDNASHFDMYAIPRTQWMQQYETLSSASEDSPINISYLITNPSFERYDENRHPIGWTVTGAGEIERGYLSGCDGQLYMNNWQASGNLSDRNISQTISNLPAGKYKLYAFSMCEFNGAYLYANDVQADMKHSTNSDTSITIELPAGGDITFGVKLENFKGNNIKYDNIRIYYIGGSLAEDVNQDGSVDSQDVLKIYEYMKTSTGTPTSATLEDVNKDGSVDSQDVLKIYDYMKNN